MKSVASVLAGLMLWNLSCTERPAQPPQYPALTFPTALGEGHQETEEPVERRGTPSTGSPTNLDEAHATQPGAAGNTNESAVNSAEPGGLPSTSVCAKQPLPDPVALRTTHYWRLVFRHHRGHIELREAAPIELERAVATPRRIGRFALELWIGCELIDRVRFDFPLLAVEEPTVERIRPLEQPPRFTEGASVEQTVLLPEAERATRMILVDRALEQRHELPWPLTSQSRWTAHGP
jgi:hypothetical protein